MNTEDLMTMHKKNVETLQNMTSLAAGVVQSAVAMQSEYMRDLFQDMQHMFKGGSNFETAQDHGKGMMSKASSHQTKMWDLTKKAAQDTSDMMTKHVRDHMENFSNKKH